MTPDKQQSPSVTELSDEPPAEVLLDAGLALSALYRGDGGWIGTEAANEQTRIVWRAIRKYLAARPTPDLGKDEELCERLRVVEGVSEWGGAPDAPTTCYHRNPDGPEAAARIEKLREALKGMVAFGEEIERRELVGDEGCFWPVEFARTALNASPKDSPDAP